MRSFKNTASRRRRRVSVVIPALCILLAGGVILSTIMLGESLGRVTPRETNIIFLVPPSKSAPPVGQAKTVYINSAPEAGEDPNEVLAQRETRVYENRIPSYAGGTKLKTQSEAMEEYYRSRSFSTSSPNGIYYGNLEVKDNAGKWDSETSVDLFKSSYGGTVESEQGDKLIAPGTSNYYDFTVENNGNIPLDYTVSIGVDAFPYENDAASALPLEWRLVDENGADVSGWRTYTNSTEVLSSGTLDIYSKEGYTIEWRWQFERGDDEYDTYMGNLSAEIPVGVDATIYVTAEQNPYWEPTAPTEPTKPDEPVDPPDDVTASDVIESNDDELIPAGSESKGDAKSHAKEQAQSKPQSASRIESGTADGHRTVYIVILAVSLTGLVIIFIIAAARRKHHEEKTNEQS